MWERGISAKAFSVIVIAYEKYCNYGAAQYSLSADSRRCQDQQSHYQHLPYIKELRKMAGADGED